MTRAPDGNLFADADPPLEGERFDLLTRSGAWRIERIVSSTTPEPGVYEQADDEWVVLLRGRAVLDVSGQRLTLEAGDYVLLPAGLRHEVLETSAGALWLAVHGVTGPDAP